MLSNLSPSREAVPLNLTALAELERAAEAMVAFAFTDVEYKKSYGAALKAFLVRKRRLRAALIHFQEAVLARSQEPQT